MLLYEKVPLPYNIDEIAFYDYTYMVQNLKNLLEERKKQEESERDKSNNNVPSYLKNPKSYQNSYMKQMPKYKYPKR